MSLKFSKAVRHEDEKTAEGSASSQVVCQQRIAVGEGQKPMRLVYYVYYVSSAAG